MPPPKPSLQPSSPPPGTPAACFKCGKPSARHITSWRNRKGNGGRPYYKCTSCCQFLCFSDDRGNDHAHPPCRCNESSKRQVSGAGTPHYVCRLGTCNFYQTANGQTREPDVVDELVAGLAAGLTRMKVEDNEVTARNTNGGTCREGVVS